MYRKTPDGQLAFDDFYLPFGSKHSGNNRWVSLAGIIPWNLAESFYSEQFSQNPQGPSAKSARLALGALTIKERHGVSDKEAVEQIRENRKFCKQHNIRMSAPPGAAAETNL